MTDTQKAQLLLRIRNKYRDEYGVISNATIEEDWVRIIEIIEPVIDAWIGQDERKPE